MRFQRWHWSARCYFKRELGWLDFPGGCPSGLPEMRLTGSHIFPSTFQFHFHPALRSCTYIPPPDAYIKERKQPYTFQGRIASSFPSFLFYGTYTITSGYSAHHFHLRKSISPAQHSGTPVFIKTLNTCNRTNALTESVTGEYT
jgi:hypothetical protein